MILPEFQPWPKIARWSREVIITEKIDGTNACVHVTDLGNVIAGSRSRWLTLEQDNFGFARWVKEHEEELKKLGPGTHFGEWWGAGIQRRHGLTEKRFSLFNVAKWSDDAIRPSCCGVVPLLGKCDSEDLNLSIKSLMYDLKHLGSSAAPGFMNPEGIVIYHTAARTMFKKTFDKDNEGKGE